MTFKEFQATKKHYVDMSEVCPQDGPGYVYEYGANIAILAAGAGLCVFLDRGDYNFDSLEEAEKFLFENWVVPHCIPYNQERS